jgi:hypothetical protein
LTKHQVGASFRGSWGWWSFWGRAEDQSRGYKHVNRRRAMAGMRSPQGSGRWVGGWKLQSFLYGGNIGFNLTRRHLREPLKARPIRILVLLPEASFECTWMEPSFPVGVTWAEMGRNLEAPTMYERDGWRRDEGSDSNRRKAAFNWGYDDADKQSLLPHEFEVYIY